MDAGGLPEWGRADLPEPPPLTLSNARRMIGPGVIAMGLALGAGEWLFGPVVTVRYQGRLMFVVLLVIFFQSILNTECIRYTLYTGEPIFSGYMRLKPGSRFWGAFFIGIDVGTNFWPGLALTAATALAAVYLGAMPTSADSTLVTWLAVAVLLLAAGVVLFGGKVYNSVERAMKVLVSLVFLYLLFVAVTMIEGATWRKIALGTLDVTSIFELAGGEEFLIVGAFVAYAGLGGFGNATISNYVRDKGWGMGSLVGAIPSAVGGRGLKLSHVGTVFPPTEPNLRRWNDWWRYVRLDQYAVWAFGSFMGMLLPSVIALQFIEPGAAVSEWGAAAVQADGIARVAGPAFWYLTILCGFFVLFSSQIGGIEILPRRWSDLLWTGFPGFRELDERWIRRVYYSVVGLYLVWCLIIAGLQLDSPLYIAALMANLRLFPIIPTFILTVFVNRRFLPPELRPPLWREVVMLVAGACYTALLIATLFLDSRGVGRKLLEVLGLW